jgi:hypothetical protein
MVEDIDDPRRQEPSFFLDERPMLEARLDFQFPFARTGRADRVGVQVSR